MTAFNKKLLRGGQGQKIKDGDRPKYQKVKKRKKS
jgi:hypothetical protein